MKFTELETGALFCFRIYPWDNFVYKKINEDLMEIVIAYSPTEKRYYCPIEETATLRYDYHNHDIDRLVEAPIIIEI